MKRIRREPPKGWLTAGWAFLVVWAADGIFLSVVPIPTHLGPGCLLRKLTGLYCPGCGGTRAFFALLTGHPLLSLYFHPVVAYTAGLFLWYVASNTVEWLSRGHFAVGSHFHRWYAYGAFALILVNWAVRNILLVCFEIPLG